MSSIDCVPTGRMVPVRANPFLVHLALAMGGFAIGTSEFAAMSLLPYFAPDLQIDEVVASHVISAYALGVVVGAPVLAVLGARMSRRRLLIALMLAYAVANLLTAFAASYGQMLAARFLAGLPHGAFFGVAALVAASVVGPKERNKAVARVMIGLTVATVLGVPFANLLGQSIGWRWGFGLVAILACLTATAVFFKAPKDAPRHGINTLSELGALANRQVLLTLATAAIGFGGFFAVYTYVASTLIDVTGAGESAVPPVLALMGIGMTLGTLLAGWGADRNPVVTAWTILGASFLLMLVYPSTTGNVWLMALVLFGIGLSGGFGTVLQTRLMDVAGEAQTMAAAMNHSAFNVANALGPLFASMAIAAGYGLQSSGYVGAALTAAGMVVYGLTLWDARRSPRWRIVTPYREANEALPDRSDKAA
ncbi:MFS transporter [Tabrizicola sp. J26]|uniref:MFS transporter n=1 Tax=Alitabrizicola rongguiensis TaxID=2909234 RepID=UPI001F47CED3|nr:MFS transporter [Tabrizicola rongguiensis]MCF1708322.1 MFS transporter [Tabrizicola rongguiensis]